MKCSTRRVAFVAAWATVVASAALLHSSRERNTPPRPRSVEVVPGIDVAALEVRFEAKRRIALDVLAGRTSLTAAAAAFRRLKDQSASVDLPDNFCGAASPEEAYCRSVICYVQQEAPPQQAEGATRRLQAELEALLRKGKLHLPDMQGANQPGDGRARPTPPAPNI